MSDSYLQGQIEPQRDGTLKGGKDFNRQRREGKDIAGINGKRIHAYKSL